MNESRKRAYRYLLYWAMLEIRRVGWLPLRGWRLLNPLRWREAVELARRAASMADWLHNLAAYSVDDFEGFNEEWFWGELESIETSHPEYRLADFRNVFADAIAGRQGSPGWLAWQ